MSNDSHQNLNSLVYVLGYYLHKSLWDVFFSCLETSDFPYFLGFFTEISMLVLLFAFLISNAIIVLPIFFFFFFDNILFNT